MAVEKLETLLYPVEALNTALAFYQQALGRASLKVDDVDRVVAKLTAAGAKVERAAEDGPHERRAVLRDPAGNPLVIHGPVSG